MTETSDLRQRLRAIIHDFNGELFVIRGHAELGFNSADDAAAAERHFNCIMERCDELMAVVQRLRDLRGDDRDGRDADSRVSDGSSATVK